MRYNLLTAKAPLTRRQFFGALTLSAVGALGYGHFLEPHWLALTRRVVPTDKPAVGPGLRLLHLSDFHLSDSVPLAFIEQAIDLGLRQDPHLICLTGDYVTRTCPELDAYARVLRKLSAAAPTVACLGNHDGGAWAVRVGGYPDTTAIQNLLANASIRCLINETVVLTVHQRTIRCSGIGDLWAQELYGGAALGLVPANDPHYHIVLAHNPDSKTDLQPFRWDLLLCGHTHGGQIRLPFLGAPLAPVEDQRFVEGLHRWEGRWLHITRGVGNLHGFRFHCRPEVSLLTLP